MRSLRACALLVAASQGARVSQEGACDDYAALPEGHPSLAAWREEFAYQPGLKVYASGCLRRAWGELAASRPPATPEGTTFASAIGAICEGEGANCSVLLHGGAVRDLMHGMRPKDIDLVWNVDTVRLMGKMEAKGFALNPSSSLTYLYLKWGHMEEGNPFEPLEGNGISSVHRGTPCESENDVNSLLYDVAKGFIIDPDGKGVEDNRQKLFRLPTACTDVADFMKGGMKRPFRYFKMIEKGYTNVDPERDIAFVVVAMKAHIAEKGPLDFQATFRAFMAQMGPEDGRKYKVVRAAIERSLPPSLLAEVHKAETLSLLELARRPSPRAEGVWEAREA